MSGNNDYYAEKMRRLMEKQKAAEAGNRLKEPGGDTADASSDAVPEKDFAFTGKRKAGASAENEKTANAENAGGSRTGKGSREQDKPADKPKKRTAGELALSICLTAALAVAVLFCVYKLFFVISTVTVTGCEAYTEEQIIASSRIAKGANLYSFSSRAVKANIQMYCPAVADIQVKRTPPGKISITVTEQKPVFVAQIYGEERGLTEDLRVLSAVGAEAKEGLVRLKLPAVKKAVAGEVICFEGKNTGYVFDVARAMFESSLSGRLGTADLRYSDNIKLTCDGKYILKLGEYKDAGVKLKIAASVLEDEMFKTGNKATLDLSDVSKTGVIVDNQLEIE